VPRWSLHQRPHRTIRAQNSVRQLEQRIAPCRQAPQQPLPELSQRAERRVPRKDWQPGTRAWQGRPHGRFLALWMYRNTKSEGNGRSAYGNQIYKRLIHQTIRVEYRLKVKLVLGFFADPTSVTSPPKPVDLLLAGFITGAYDGRIAVQPTRTGDRDVRALFTRH
jgi:hypothetical protein